jgi:hypothetical protein
MFLYVILPFNLYIFALVFSFFISCFSSFAFLPIIPSLYFQEVNFKDPKSHIRPSLCVHAVRTIVSVSVHMRGTEMRLPFDHTTLVLAIFSLCKLRKVCSQLAVNFFHLRKTTRSRGSSVNIVSGYGPGDRGSIPGRDKGSAWCGRIGYSI